MANVWRVIFDEIQREGKRKIQTEANDNYLSGEILQDSGRVHGGGGSDASMACCAVFQVTVNTTDRELFGDETRN